MATTCASLLETLAFPLLNAPAGGARSLSRSRARRIGQGEEGVDEARWHTARSREETRGGAGLGLPIVEGIVEAHSGHIWVESAPGEGSMFYFTIPTTAPKDTSADLGPSLS